MGADCSCAVIFWLSSLKMLALCVRQSFVVGPKFCGVKMLPPGPHLVSYNAASRGGAELAPTTSFFVHAPARSVLVRRWDAGAELLAELEEDEVTSPCCKFHHFCAKRYLRPCQKGPGGAVRTLRPAPCGQAERYVAGVRRFDFDAGLAPCNLAAYAQWRALSGHLTPAVLARLSPAQARPHVNIEQGACREYGFARGAQRLGLQ